MGDFEALHYNAMQIKPCIAPLIIYPNGLNIHANNWKCGGTCFFVKSETITFLVTAAHVYDEVENCGVEFCPLLLPVNGAEPVDISKWRMISKSNFIDIAVVEVPPSFNLSSIGKDTFTYNSSPETRVAVGESVFFMGYPGEHRTADSSSLTARITPCMDFVTSVNDRAFFMSDDFRERKSSSFDPEFNQIASFGGLSGSPMLAVRDGIFNLVGIFIEGAFQSEGIHSPFKGAHFDFITPDGSLDHLRIPY
ncbi:trypsin-like peptidase domain-containing protein [Pectobacterium aroidearum]|uniref:trypsin-like peptidase domain-containing protein n=1 Tax=Pectobacterium aroidearum TaxID=1201031 RepID=UPI003158C9A0